MASFEVKPEEKQIIINCSDDWELSIIAKYIQKMPNPLKAIEMIKYRFQSVPSSKPTGFREKKE